MDQPQLPPQLRIMQIGLGFANTLVIHNLVKAGVVEELRNGPKSLADLSQNCELNLDMLFRTLRFAGSIDIIALDNGQYTLTQLGRMLLKDVPGSFYSAAMIIGMPPWQNAWGNFAYALKTGEDAFEPVMGETFFDYLDKNAEYGEPFNQWQTVLTTMTAGAICENYDFSPFNTVCDIGGGHGTLLKGILTANPHLSGILFDQKNVVEGHILADLEDRARIQPGSFFEHVPSADLLIMKNILHDWSDEKCSIILANCREAMAPDARLLVVERVVNEPVEPLDAFYDLHMQVILGGKERTESEFRKLFQDAGMKLERIIQTRSPMNLLEVTS